MSFETNFLKKMFSLSPISALCILSKTHSNLASTYTIPLKQLFPHNSGLFAYDPFFIPFSFYGLIHPIDIVLGYVVCFDQWNMEEES